jgi:hypothetical protein
MLKQLSWDVGDHCENLKSNKKINMQPTEVTLLCRVCYVNPHDDGSREIVLCVCVWQYISQLRRAESNMLI